MLAAWIGGLGPGLFAVALAAVSALLFFLRPVLSFWILETADRVSLPSFVLVGCAMAWFIDYARRQERAHLEAARAADGHARELEAIFEAIPDGVYVGTADGITQANAVGLKMIGAHSMEQLNRDLRTLADASAIRSAATGEPLPGDRLQFARALDGHVVTEEVIARRAASPTS